MSDRIALLHVLRQLLVKIYESGFPLPDGFDEYELWIEGMIHGTYDPEEIRERYNSHGQPRAYITALHMSLVYIHFEDYDRALTWAKSCAGILASNQEAGVAIALNMMEDFKKQ